MISPRPNGSSSSLLSFEFGAHGVDGFECVVLGAVESQKDVLPGKLLVMR